MKTRQMKTRKRARKSDRPFELSPEAKELVEAMQRVDNRRNTRPIYRPPLVSYVEMRELVG